jgi:hypothetical protein
VRSWTLAKDSSAVIARKRSAAVLQGGGARGALFAGVTTFRHLCSRVRARFGRAHIPLEAELADQAKCAAGMLARIVAVAGHAVAFREYVAAWRRACIGGGFEMGVHYLVSRYKVRPTPSRPQAHVHVAEHLDSDRELGARRLPRPARARVGTGPRIRYPASESSAGAA